MESGSKAYLAELMGTFWLVLGGCGAAVISALVPGTGIGQLGVSLAFGLSVLTMAYLFGEVSGAHMNPAITLGMAMNKRIPSRNVVPYIAAQVLGAILAAGTLYLVARGKAGFSLSEGFAANGYAAHSPQGYDLRSGFIAEFVLTFGFVMVALAATAKSAPKGFAPIAIGLCLTLIHLIAIPVTNVSVNPARSTGQALFVGGWAVKQLWLFWLAPLLGGAAAGAVYPLFAGSSRDHDVTDESEQPHPPRYSRPAGYVR